MSDRRAKIALNAVRKGFVTAKGETLPVVDGLSLEVKEGEFVAIVGPSGCGKSTLMNLVAGFERPDSGQVHIDARAVSGPGPKGVVISQHGSVFPWLTVRQNLTFGLSSPGHAETSKSSIALADHYAAMVGLQGFEGAYPHELSGGMLKRVELARALIVKPEILYLDEPFSALDALMNMKMRNELLRILAEERHTVLLITHDVEEAIYMADRVLVLSARPTRVQTSFEITMRHPRKLSDARAQELREAILGALGLAPACTA